jgi:molybdenum cofactor guanylyltransferase
MRVSGVIQAGGKSARMGGRPKALMEVGGRRIVERVAAVLAPLVDDMLLVTNTPDMYAFLGLPMVGDLYPDAGALGGLYTGVASAPGDVAFTVACDMPFLHRDVARLVIDRAAEADVVVPRVGHQLETLHAAYGKACLPHMEARIRAGRLKIVGFFESVRVLEIPEAEVLRHADPSLAFMNVNTPDELTRAMRLATFRD